jgi:hypothetical protein
MAVTPVSLARLQERIAEVEAQTAVLAPYGGALSNIRGLALLMQAIEDLGSASTAGGGTTSATVTGGVDASTLIAAIKTGIDSLVASQQKRYQTNILQDATGTLYISRLNEETGLLTNIGFNGSPYTPTAPIKAPDSADSSVVIETEYEALVTIAGFTSGDQLTRIVTKIGGTTTVTWVNDSTGIVLSVAPTLPAQAKPLDDYKFEILEDMRNYLVALTSISQSHQLQEELFYTISSNPGFWENKEILKLVTIRTGDMASPNDSYYWYNFSTGVQITGATADPVIGGDCIVLAQYLIGTASSGEHLTRLVGADGGTVAIVLNGIATPSISESYLLAGLAPNANDVKLNLAAGELAAGLGTSSATSLRIVEANDSPGVLAIGNATDVSLAPNNAAASTLKGVMRGLWQSLTDLIGNTTDVSLPANSAATASIKGLLRFLNNNLAATVERIGIPNSAGGIAAGTILIPVFDALRYQTIEFNIAGTATGAGAIEVQQSISPSFATFNVVTSRKINQNGFAAIGVNPNGHYVAPILCRYVRIIVSGSYTGGTLVGTANLSPAPLTETGVAPVQSLATNAGSVSVTTQRIVQAQLIASRIGAAVTPLADTPLTSPNRIRQLLFTNNSASILFLQIFTSPTALTATSVPNVLVIRVPANATLDKTVADFGESGTFYGANTRIAVSTTFGTFTAATAPVLALCSLSIEVV